MNALLVVSHGSRDRRAARTTDALLAAIRRRRPGLLAAVGYLDHARPSVAEAVDALVADGSRAVVAVPLLLTAAFHSRVDVPRELARAADRHADVEFRCAAVLGPDPLLLDGLERRLRDIDISPGDRDTAVVLGAAGTSDARGLATIGRLASQWRERAGWWDVVPAYASASGPTVPEAVAALRRAGAPRVVVASYVIAPGRLPDRILAGAPDGVPVSAPLGDADELAVVVLARFASAARAAASAAVRTA